jgi:uncharacterized RmlC-like cupin family protein
VVVSSNNPRNLGISLHLHQDLDETFYVLEGQVKFQVGDEILYLNPGDHLFAPRKVPHAWVCNSEEPAKILITSQPAGKMEEFFITLSELKTLTPEISGKLYQEHEMQILGPPLAAD